MASEALYTREEIVYPLSDQMENCIGYKGRKELPVSHLVLHLSKALSVEWFPGCEWWSSVFIGDEEIDTSTCTVGTDTSELSKEAWLRAQREHARFSDLSVEEREKELQGLARLKKEATEAVQSYQREEKQALNEEPEREREMLGALSAEFPHIYFGAKANVGRDVAQKDGGLDS